MILDYNNEKQRIEQKKESLKAQSTEPSPTTGFVQSVISKLGELQETLLKEQGEKPSYFTYMLAEGETCPFCQSAQVGWIAAQIYPEGLDRYVIEAYPWLSEFADKPYRQNYPPHEALECLNCRKIIRLEGSMLRRAVAVGKDTFGISMEQ